VRTARRLFPLVDKSGDEPTADLLTQRLQIHEKNAWMLRSLLETDAPTVPAVSDRRKKR
jgi:starvation-inducible DNA-binding protein